MNALARLALLGTSRADNEPASGTPVDALVPAGPSRERRLLLTAGAWALYRRAGRTPAEAPAPPPVAPDERTVQCAPIAATVVRGMLLGTHRALLPEALERLHRAGQHLPPELLPLALSVGNRTLHEPLSRVLGERGRWLVALDPAFEWPVAPPPSIAEDPRATWVDGVIEDRLAALRAVRATDPATARAWVAEVWGSERAEVRSELVDALDAGLGPEDEAFLDAALGDRAESVRIRASQLLARISGSAHQRALTALADPLVAGPPWSLEPPVAFGESWAALGIREKVGRGLGERAWWGIQLVGLVPPAHWATSRAREPAALLEDVPPDGSDLLEAWARGALLHGDQAWMAPLWQALWARRTTLPKGRRAVLTQIRRSLLERMPAADARRCLAELMASPEVEGLDEALANVPAPWPMGLATVWLHRVLERARHAEEDAADVQNAWTRTLAVASTSLPHGIFPNVPDEAPVPEDGRWRSRAFASAWDRMVARLRVRARLAEVIPIPPSDPGASDE